MSLSLGSIEAPYVPRVEWDVERGCHLPWRGAVPLPPQKILVLFLLEMARFGANSVVYFNRNLRLFTARTTTVTVYCWRLAGSPTGEGSGEGSQPPPQKIWDYFYLKWLIFVQIQLYFNRNVRQFTARTTTVTVYMYCWRLRGESNPPLDTGLQWID